MNHKKDYDVAYQKENMVQKKLAFNRRVPDDLILLDWIESQENFSQYCKNLIRSDMLKNRPPGQPVP